MIRRKTLACTARLPQIGGVAAQEGADLFAALLETGADEQALRALALQAFNALGVSGWGRVDVMRDRQGGFWLLEVNTAPGMTSHSLAPKAAAAVGIGYDELCWRVLETSLDRGGGR